MKAAFAHYVGIVILLSYFAVTLLIGWFSRRPKISANSFLNATHSISLPVVTISYLAANSGAMEILGLNAAAAQYGVQAFHFYWIGAIPALIFLSLWLMPVYRRSGIRSVPEYFEKRYGPDVRLLNACIVAITRLLLGVWSQR
jgi:solute:Na+ symporter, SSS family